MGRRGRILVTGANGFVGRAVSRALLERDWQVRCAVRSLAAAHGLATEAEVYVVGNISGDTDWASALDGVKAVIHVAARVHVMASRGYEPVDEYERVNVNGTVRLAEAAVARDVRRLVFVSSVKVNGEASGERAFRESDAPAPVGTYALSKWRAEQGLQRVARSTGLEVVVVRPPLVYGPGVKANFLVLLKAVARGVPLPLASVRNRRSLVYIGNLVDFLSVCVEHPAAAGQTFLVADKAPVSTAELVRQMGVALGRPARSIPVPPALVRMCGWAAGKGAAVRRLTDSLVVDIEKARSLLDWEPPFAFEDGLRATAQCVSRKRQ